MRPPLSTLLLLWAESVCVVAAEESCFPEKFNSNSVVCVCSSENCAQIGKILPKDGRAVVYESSMAGLRFDRTVVDFDSDLSPHNTKDSGPYLTMSVDANRTLQKIIGFGGAFTDAAGINWMSLDSQALRDHLIEAYYGPDGLEYNMGRIPMGGCDASTRDYTYADKPDDFELSHFALAPEDTDYKIPMITAVNKHATEQVLYFGSPWSAPAWMKTNGHTTGLGGMKGYPGGPYYKTWAQYFVNFYEAYKSHGVNLWGFTIQNEPTSGFLPWKWQTMAMTPYTQRDFLKWDLGPALFNATQDNITIMVMDDQRFALPWWTDAIFSDPDASKYAAGVGVHWYWDNFGNASVYDAVLKAYPDKFIINTEACEGYQPLTHNVILGRWERAESYATSLIEDFRHSMSGWIDWNLCLDLIGGPNWVKNYVDAPIIVDKDKQAFYKQPMYYALAHFTKFIPRGSYRLSDEIQTSVKELSGVAFQRWDGLKSAVFLNKGSNENVVIVKDASGHQFRFKIGPRSIASAIW